MIYRIKNKLLQALATIQRLEQRFDELKLNQGLILSELHERKTSIDLQSYEFKVYSQWGEDGIIQRLVNVLEIPNKTFIEFGVEDFFESNCRFLMEKDNWRGLVIDGSPANIERLKRSHFFWKHDLQAITAFITRENINGLLSSSGFDHDIGILSIDLDGNDFHILQAIVGLRPRILICEYNAVFGGIRPISVPYAADFVRQLRHPSNLYAGASLAATTHLARAKGYSLVGTNSACNNAFFVRDDLVCDAFRVLTAAEAWRPSLFRESMNSQGSLDFTRSDDRLALLKGMPVVNVVTGEVEAL